MIFFIFSTVFFSSFLGVSGQRDICKNCAENFLNRCCFHLQLSLQYQIPSMLLLSIPTLLTISLSSLSFAHTLPFSLSCSSTFSLSSHSPSSVVDLVESETLWPDRIRIRNTVRSGFLRDRICTILFDVKNCNFGKFIIYN
jgi:hypothetical protein